VTPSPSPTLCKTYGANSFSRRVGPAADTVTVKPQILEDSTRMFQERHSNHSRLLYMAM
jgi:hypothetical protein